MVKPAHAAQWLAAALRRVRPAPLKATLRPVDDVAAPLVDGPIPHDADEPERCDYCGAPAACCQQGCPEYRDMLSDEFLEQERRDRWDDEH